MDLALQTEQTAPQTKVFVAALAAAVVLALQEAAAALAP
jgi:hypothetical protein